jgi:hypothetical protein
MLRRCVFIAVLPTTLLAAGCYTTNGIAGSGLRSLGVGGHGRDVLLTDDKAKVRVEPHSWIRFQLADGRVTRWFYAKDLRLVERTVLASGCASSSGRACAAIEVLPLDTIAHVEVNDFSLGHTAGGIVLGTSAVVGAVVAEVTLMALIEAITFGHAKVNGLGLVEGTMHAVADEIGKRPTDEDWDGLEGPGADLVHYASARPLFNRTALRRDWIRLVTTTEIGSDDVNPLYPVTSLCATVRLRNIVELGGGVRMDAQPLGEGAPPRPEFVPFVRAGLHLDLDANRRFAIPAFVDIGGVSGQTRTRFAFGLRIRINDGLNLGLFPYNPTLASGPADGSPQVRTAHTTTVELGFAL